MPLDGNNFASDPKTAPAAPAIDTSKGLGKALAGGDIAAQVPGALAQEQAQAEQKKKVAADAAATLDKAQVDRHLLAHDLPKAPAPIKPPEMQQNDPTKAWGSAAMALGILASGFTRRPLTNALNAAAGVMNAYRQKDVDAYKAAFEKWKAESDYGIKLYEYQRDAYKDALDAIGTDEKTAVAKATVLSHALNDPAMTRLLEAKNIGAAVDKQRMDEAALEKLKLETEHAHRNGVLEQEGMVAQAKLDAALKANDVPGAAAAQQELHSIAERKKLLSTNPAASTTAVREQKADDLFNKLKQDWQADPKNQGKTFSAQDEAKLRTEAEAAAAGRSAQGRGAQAATQIGALMGSTVELAPALKNLVDLPISATLGPFMGVQGQTPDGLKDALTRTMATKLTPDTAIAIQQQFAGVSRALATIEAQGARTGLVGLQKSSETLVPKEGWSGLDVLRSYGEIRQIVEQNVKTMMASPYVTEEQKTLLQSTLGQIEKAVPWTVHDVNEVAFGKDKEKSVREFADKILHREGQTLGVPKKGEIIDGHEFQGGDPADPRNWKKQ